MPRILFSISASGRGNLEREPGHPTSELLALLCFGLFNEFGVGDFHAARLCTARYRAMRGDQRARDRGRHGVADAGHLHGFGKQAPDRPQAIFLIVMGTGEDAIRWEALGVVEFPQRQHSHGDIDDDEGSARGLDRDELAIVPKARVPA